MDNDITTEHKQLNNGKKRGQKNQIFESTKKYIYLEDLTHCVQSISYTNTLCTKYKLY